MKPFGKAPTPSVSRDLNADNTGRRLKAHTLQTPWSPRFSRPHLSAMITCPRQAGRQEWTCRDLPTAAPAGPRGRAVAPAAQPTGRALTKGIWSFFQDK